MGAEVGRPADLGHQAERVATGCIKHSMAATGLVAANTQWGFCSSKSSLLCLSLCLLACKMRTS